MAAGGLAAVALAAGGVAALNAGGEGTGADASASKRPRPTAVREGSKPLPKRVGALVITDEPGAYRLAYRVETFGAGERVVSRDELEIRRPFDGRTRKREGAKATDAVRSEQIGVFGRIHVPRSSDASPVLLETGPALAPSDLRIRPVLEDLLDAGLAEAREWREVGGRPCQVIRFGGPISSGTVPLALEPKREYADACVDDRGLVLEELWVETGRVQRRRLATAVRVEDPVREDAFAVGAGDALPVDQGGGSMRPVDPASSYAGDFWVLDTPPLPTYEGRWAVVNPAGGDPATDEVKDRRLGYVADVWRGGIDVVVVEQGSTAGGVPPFELGAGPRVTVEGLGEGEFVPDLRTSEVRLLQSNGHFVRVRGTLARAGLEALARLLRRIEGGPELRYLDGP